LQTQTGMTQKERRNVSMARGNAPQHGEDPLNIARFWQLFSLSVETWPLHLIIMHTHICGVKALFYACAATNMRGAMSCILRRRAVLGLRQEFRLLVHRGRRTPHATRPPSSMTHPGSKSEPIRKGFRCAQHNWPK
jgi:hypothetical protein